jgi:DNA-binding NarL/FixJ family response regulator
MKNRVYIVDDHALTRRGVAALVDAEGDLMTCGEAETAEQAIEQIRALRPDVSIIDLALRNSSGLDLIRQLHQSIPSMRILALSMYDEMVYAPQVLEAGAHAYVMKQDVLSTVVKAIRHVLTGSIHLSDRVADAIKERAASEEKATTGGFAGLTMRERELAYLIGCGLSSREIATYLRSSVKAVAVLRDKLKVKLNFANGVQLVQFCVHYLDTLEREAGPRVAPVRRQLMFELNE